MAEKRRYKAEQLTRIAVAQSLAETAFMTMETDPELSLLLAIKSVNTTYKSSSIVLPLSDTVLR